MNPADLLPRVGGDELAGEAIEINEESGAGAAEIVIELGRFTRRKRCVAVRPLGEVTAAALDIVMRQFATRFLAICVRSSAKNSGRTKPGRERNSSFLPLCGVAVRRTRWRSALAERSFTKACRCC